VLNLLQREAQKLEGENALEAKQVGIGIEPIARLGMSGWLEQANFVVVAQGANGDGGERGKLAGVVKVMIQGLPPFYKGG
jgi:hypothetical protein